MRKPLAAGKFNCRVDAIQFWMDNEHEVGQWIYDRHFYYDINDEDNTLILYGTGSEGEFPKVEEGDWLVCICRGCMIEIFCDEMFREMFVPPWLCREETPR